MSKSIIEKLERAKDLNNRIEKLESCINSLNSKGNPMLMFSEKSDSNWTNSRHGIVFDKEFGETVIRCVRVSLEMKQHKLKKELEEMFK